PSTSSSRRASASRPSPTWTRTSRSSAPRWRRRAAPKRRRTLGRKARRHSALVVLVVTAPPDAGLVAPLGGAVEPLVHAPQAIQPARIRGVSVVDDAAVEHERADPRPLARIGGRVGSGRGRNLGDEPLAAAQGPRRLAPEVVVDASLALLLLGEPDGEVGVEVAAERGR